MQYPTTHTLVLSHTNTHTGFLHWGKRYFMKHYIRKSCLSEQRTRLFSNRMLCVLSRGNSALVCLLQIWPCQKVILFFHFLDWNISVQCGPAKWWWWNLNMGSSKIGLLWIFVASTNWKRMQKLKQHSMFVLHKAYPLGHCNRNCV